jgi:hypothetical protein
VIINLFDLDFICTVKTGIFKYMIYSEAGIRPIEKALIETWDSELLLLETPGVSLNRLFPVFGIQCFHLVKEGVWKNITPICYHIKHYRHLS